MARRIRRSIGPLDLRAQAILRAVIEEYVTTATPVGSQALVDRYRLGVSSATVRNILAELELAGLLGHPHTSAGRIPTDAGYRWYVESIIDSAPLPEVEQLMIRHQFGQVEFASEHWFRLAASTIASMTHAAGLATPAKPASARVRRVDLVSINDHMASLVVVLREGSIKQSLVTLATVGGPGGPHHRGRDPERDRCAAEPPRRSRAALASLDPALPHADLVARVGERIVRVLSDYDRAAVEEVFSDGLLNVMGAPEFAHSEKLRRVFTALENRAYLGELVGSVAASGRRQGLHRRGERAARHARGRPRARAVRPPRSRGRRRRRPRANAPRLFRGDRTVRFVSGLMNELVDHLYN